MVDSESQPLLGGGKGTTIGKETFVQYGTEDQGDSLALSVRDSPPPTCPTSTQEEVPRFWQLMGYTFSIVAGLCFTASNVFIKYTPLASSWQMLCVRCVIQILIMFPLMLATKSPIFGPPDLPSRCRLVAQSIVGGVFLLVTFEAVERLPIGDCTAIFFSSPVFTMILSTCLLRDHCGLYRLGIGAFLTAGVVIISRPPGLFPPDSTHHKVHSNDTATNSAAEEEEAAAAVTKMVSIAIALMAPLLSALLAIITRQARHIHYSVLVFWFAVGGLLVSIAMLLTLQSQQKFILWDLETWLLTFLQSFLGIAGAIMMTKAVCWVTPSKVMVIRSFQVILSFMLQVWLFGTVPHTMDLVGSVCIGAAVLGMGLEDRILPRLRLGFL